MALDHDAIYKAYNGTVVTIDDSNDDNSPRVASSITVMEVSA